MSIYKKTKIFFFLLMVFSIFGFVKSSWAANLSCDGTLSDCQNKINASSDGDTISLPSGNFPWSGTLSISRNIILRGNGNANTHINGGTIDPGTTHSRITGFDFIGTNIMAATGNGWRIDHNNFTYPSRTYGIYVWSPNDSAHATGVIDNNKFTDTAIVVFGYCSESGPDSSSGIWALPLDLGGGEEVVYVEDNTFTSGSSSEYTTDSVDSNCGGRYVFRHNTVINSDVDNHGVQGYDNRGSMRTEIYDNTFTNNAAATFLAIYFRGGTGVIFNNTFNGNYNNITVADNQTSCRYGTYNASNACAPGVSSSKCGCDGNNPRDGNRAGMDGYPCRDQIGRGNDTTRWYVGQPFSQTFNPLYTWNNKSAGIETSILTSWDINCSRNTEHLQVNRDYFNGASGTQTSPSSPFNGTSGVGYGTLANRPATCAASSESGGGVAYWATDTNTLYRCSSVNTWTVQYKPYTYPNPIRTDCVNSPLTCDSTGDTTAPAAPQVLSVQ